MHKHISRAQVPGSAALRPNVISHERQRGLCALALRVVAERDLTRKPRTDLRPLGSDPFHLKIR